VEEIFGQFSGSKLEKSQNFPPFPIPTINPTKKNNRKSRGDFAREFCSMIDKRMKSL
jgi:hypothetical protein